MPGDPLPFRRRRNRQHAPRRVNRSVQRELAEKHQIRNVPPLDHALRGQDAERDRQIERRAHFAHIGRRQVHGDAMRGKLEAGIADGAPDAVAAFAHARVGQADHLEAGHPERHVDLDVYGAGLDAKERGGAQPGKHPASGAANGDPRTAVQ